MPFDDMILKGVFVMAKDPEPRDWKIDKYISKCIAMDPDKELPSYEEVGKLIDKWDNMGRHITYPMAGNLWNQIEWQHARDVRKFIEKNYPNTIEIQPFYSESRLIKKLILENGQEEIIGYNSGTGDIEEIDMNNTDKLKKILSGLDEPINQMSKIKPVPGTRKPNEILSAMKEARSINKKSRFIEKE
jgi:hypothetical protein